MNAEEIIASGKLELYVTGSLAQEEIEEVEAAIARYPALKKEVEKIEQALIGLAEAVAPSLPSRVWGYISGNTKGVRKLDTGRTTISNWSARIGWAAAILCMAGIFWMLKQNNDLKDTLQVTTIKNTVLQEQNEMAQDELQDANSLLAILRSKDYETITLPGNEAVAPEAFSKVYFNRKEQVAYIDINGLPDAPDGKVYQVWSLIMEPLTPRNVGLIESTAEIASGIYRFENIPDPEAFGITLEPAGGSEGPTLSQLYTLGTVGQ